MFILGIDLRNDYSQVCYYNMSKGEPESVSFKLAASDLRVPTVVLREYENVSGWMAGEVAVSCSALGEGVLFDRLLDAAKEGKTVTKENISASPAKLIMVYLTFLIQSASRAFGSDEKPDKICICIEDFCSEILAVIDEAVGLMDIPKESVIYSSHVEAFVYYSLCQKKELWKNDNVVFDYGKDGLIYSRMATAPYCGSIIVMSERIDLRKQVGYTTDSEELEDTLLKKARELFDKKLISTVYLTGEGFDGGFSCDRFINFVCNKRRAFAGQNLYVKGACYQAYEMSVGDRLKDFIICCNERIPAGIEMKICDRGVDKILRMVRPGTNWYKAGCSYDFIVDDCREIEIFLSPVGRREKRQIKIPLTDFPVRDDKASRITVKLDFSDDSHCHLTVEDKGFGEFVKSSNKIIKEDILLWAE